MTARAAELAAAIASRLATMPRPPTVEAGIPPPPPCIVSVDLGRVAFADAAALQQRLQAAQADTAAPLPHLLLHVEHDPVFTVTRRTDPAHIRWDAAECARRGVTVEPVDRGGDVTFHGPGQLVVYPLLDLRAFGHLSPSAWSARLESAVIRLLSGFGIAARREPGMPGVWVQPPGADSPAKISALGVRVSRFRTRHGVSINVTTDLAWFDGIVPCGLPLPVTSVARVWPAGAVPLPPRANWLDAIDAAIAGVLECRVIRLARLA